MSKLPSLDKIYSYNENGEDELQDCRFVLILKEDQLKSGWVWVGEGLFKSQIWFVKVRNLLFKLFLSLPRELKKSKDITQQKPLKMVFKNSLFTPS